MQFIKFSFFDFSKEWQCLFQDPASSIMENIIDLHHDIVFFQIIIITLVLWMIIRIFFFFKEKNLKIKRSLDLTHNIIIEIIWTITPTIILIFIAIPSYVLIYNLDEMNDPKITLKIIGHQWYWSYEYSDYSKISTNILSENIFFLENEIQNLLINNIELFNKSLLFKTNENLTLEQFIYWENLYYDLKPRDQTILALFEQWPAAFIFNFLDGNYYSFHKNYILVLHTLLETYKINTKNIDLLTNKKDFFLDAEFFWFWLNNNKNRFYIELLPEDSLLNLIKLKKSLPENNISFDSYMLQEEDLEFGQLRLLEVDNNIYLPIETTVRLLITASDVIHSWTIPSLGIKMDAIPGRLNQVGIYINRESNFYGQCSELCGINHSFMPIGLKTVLLEEYFDWLNFWKNKNI